MMNNNLKLALRNFRKDKTFTVVNVFGLTSGLAIALLLFLYIRNETSFDKAQAGDRPLYRLVFHAQRDGKSEKWGSSPNIAGPAFKENIAGIKAQARLIRHDFGDNVNVRFGNNRFFESNFYWTDSTFTDVFQLDMLAGNPQRLLNKPNTVLISESTAKKYFGNLDPVGQVINVANAYDCEITGVYRDFPNNGSLDADFLGSITTIKWMVKNVVWSNASFETYLLLQDGTTPQAAEQQMKQVMESQVEKDDRWFTFSLQPYTEMHLHSADVDNTYIKRVGDLKQVKIVSALALIILLIVCINYMNLATARSQKRYKEVGICKTVGASRSMLVRRFYAETTLLVCIAFVFALLLTALLLPAFNRFAGTALDFSAVLETPVMLACGGALLLLILISGSYPAFYLSAFRPKNLFQHSFRRGSSGGRVRQALVVVQFTVSIVMIFSTIILYRQLLFVQNENTGFHPEQVVSVTTSAASSKEEIASLMNDVRSLSGVRSVCRSQTYPGNGGSGRTLSDAAQTGEGSSLTTCRASSEITDVLGLKLLAGKSYTDNITEQDTTYQVILNKTAVDFLGMKPEEVIGKRVGAISNQDEVVGVVADFHFEDLHKPIGAYAFHNAPTEGRPCMLVRADAAGMHNLLPQIETLFRKNIPGSAFEYKFLDEHFRSLYEKEEQTAQLALLFSVLAVLLACLGLFGLSAFLVEQRLKEIGVRKVLGASLAGITTLVTRSFVIMVLIAAVIALPFAGWLMQQWLNDFAYRISISWLYFAATLGIALVTALLTVSFQAIRAARQNPVSSLRSE